MDFVGGFNFMFCFDEMLPSVDHYRFFFLMVTRLFLHHYLNLWLKMHHQFMQRDSCRVVQRQISQRRSDGSPTLTAVLVVRSVRRIFIESGGKDNNAVTSWWSSPEWPPVACRYCYALSPSTKMISSRMGVWGVSAGMMSHPGLSTVWIADLSSRKDESWRVFCSCSSSCCWLLHNY